MNVLILGSGGREHAVYVKLAQSDFIKNLWIAPGNAGLEDRFRFPELEVTNFEAILEKVKEHKIDFLFVGPEQPLADGIVDFFAKEMPQLLVFGPNRYSAQLESSKIFAAEFIEKANLPVCRSEAAFSLKEAREKIKTFSLPIVIKADGLAAGKGVSIHNNFSDAERALQQIFKEKIFGESGSKVLLQEFMQGTEASLFALMNGKEAILLPTARDYKAAYEKNQGVNTGGMGSVSPGTALSEEHINSIYQTIVTKVLEHFAYKGILYIGLMVHSQQPEDYSIVEFNCRLGDPETQCVLPMIETDLFPYLLWACGAKDTKEDILKVQVKDYYRLPTKSGFAVNVVLVAKDYPADYEKNIPLKLPDELLQDVHIIHAGTKSDKTGNLFSSGGRILSVVSVGKNLEQVKDKVYSVLEIMQRENDFSRLRFRSDIASEINMK